MYNRAVRVLKTIYEAQQRPKLDVFENWLQNSGKGKHLDDYLESGEFTSITNEPRPDHVVNAADRSEALFQFWREYEDEILCYNFHPMPVFWNSFLELAETLLDYLKSSQSGNWELHLHSMERMLTCSTHTTTPLMPCISHIAGQLRKVSKKNIHSFMKCFTRAILL